MLDLSIAWRIQKIVNNGQLAMFYEPFTRAQSAASTQGCKRCYLVMLHLKLAGRTKHALTPSNFLPVSVKIKEASCRHADIFPHRGVFRSRNSQSALATSDKY